MKIKFDATIRYTVDEKHPDYKECKLEKGKVYDFSDSYIMDEDYFYSIDQMISYIKRDLKLVAGGGYDYDHIHRVV